MAHQHPEFVVIDAPAWSSPPLAVFEVMSAQIDARFGPPRERALDSNGHGLFDAHYIRFSCGLEVALWRFHRGPDLRPINPAIDPSLHEIRANRRDVAHIAFHLGVPRESMRLWRDADGVPLAGPSAPLAFAVMRSDDNGNDVEITRVTSRCEAASIVEKYESRGHKQMYWIA